MSKLGKLPVAVPAGVTVTVNPDSISVKGPKGELHQHYGKNVKVSFENGNISVTPNNTSKQANADHGLYRSLIKDMVIGVTAGFSNDFIALIPDGLTVAADANGKVTVSGISKQQVGQFCAEIRSLRKPEPYKGKGIRYETEIIRRKVGKTGVK